MFKVNFLSNFNKNTFIVAERLTLGKRRLRGDIQIYRPVHKVEVFILSDSQITVRKCSNIKLLTLKKAINQMTS